jgi:S1-C subfamily serine protease
MTQNNFRAAVGIVYSFGGTESVQQPRLTRASRVSMSDPALGVMVAAREDGGAEIVEVLPGSVAALANLRVGDIINLVDGKPIKTPMELTAELSNRGPGTKIRLGYMVRGYWQSETVVTLQPE